MEADSLPVDLNLPDESEYPSDLTKNYELLECLSEKEDTRTLLAANRKTGDVCVVKCFLKTSPLFTHQEPEVLRSIHISSLPCFLAEYINENMRCVVREYIPGETLYQLAKSRSFSEDEVLSIGLQLCDELEVLHNSSPPVIHRDIKPQNVVIRPDGSASLIDFGIARTRTDQETDTVAFGTQGFAPPEQYGFAQTDSRSDIYSLGVLLYWLLHRETRVPRTGKTPLENVLSRCASFDPENRYASVGQVRRALVSAKPETRKKKKWLWTAAVLLLLLAVPACIWAVRSGRSKITFAEPMIEEAVRSSLGLGPTEPLTIDLLKQVTSVCIIADQVCPNPDSFYTAVNQWYSEGQKTKGTLQDLSDLTLLPNLEQICIAAQQISDLSPLVDLQNLTKVELKHNWIEDISPFVGLDNLVSVGINDNPVKDISPLVQCPDLAFLDLCSVRGYDASVLQDLGDFEFLDISNPTDSYRYLAGKSIRDLRIAWTDLTDLHVLDEVDGLEYLEIDHTKVTDLSPLAVHKDLKFLKLTGLSVTDLQVLKELPRLQEVRLGSDLESAAALLGDVPFLFVFE